MKSLDAAVEHADYLRLIQSQTFPVEDTALILAVKRAALHRCMYYGTRYLWELAAVSQVLLESATTFGPGEIDMLTDLREEFYVYEKRIRAAGFPNGRDITTP